MNRAEMDAAILKAIDEAGLPTGKIVLPSEQVAFIAGMRAAADLIVVEGLHEADEIIRAAADELEGKA